MQFRMSDFLSPFKCLQMLKNIIDTQKSKQYLVLFILQMMFWCNVLSLPLAMYQDFFVRHTFHNSILNVFLQVLYFFGCYQAYKGNWRQVFIIPLFILASLAVASQFINGADSSLIIFYVLLLVLIQIVYSLRITVIAFLITFFTCILINVYRPENFAQSIGYESVPVLHDYVAFFCSFIILIVMAFFVRQQTFLNVELIKSNENLEEASNKKELAKKELSHLNADLENRILAATSQLTMALKEAEDANNAKSDFLAKMSHEMRTPLNGILGFGELLSTEKNEDSKTEYTHAIIQSGEHLLSIVNDILDVAKVERSNIIIEDKDFDLDKTAKHIMQSVSGFAHDANVKIKVHTNQTHSHFYGDEQKLKQIVINLLSNAIKFSNHKDVEFSLEEYEDASQIHWVEVKVKDSGIGIAEQDLERIFEPFQQCDNSNKREYGGTGLGLCIVKSYVDLMGGNIEVKTELKKGSEFIVKLPFEIRQPKAFESNHTVINEVDSEYLKTIKVLLVEDNPVNMKVAQTYLKKIGIDCEVSENGQIAVNKIQDHDFDLVFMDCQMPVMDGLEATKIVRESDIDQPYIVALTANAMEKDKKVCFDVGMDSFLAKPIQRETLNSVLANFLKKKKSA